MTQIKLEKVTKRFKDVVAVDRLSLKVHEGEYLVILGPTGAGKTTTLKLIAGLLKPDEGEIYFDNELVNEFPPEERDVGFVFQGYALFPFLNVWRNVTFGPWVKGFTGKELNEIGEETLSLVHLLHRASSFPKELSGGMQQRIALARALATKPRILLLDEPLSALDAVLRVKLRYELREMIKELGLTAIHVTHDQEEAMSIADRIVVFRRGRIEQVGSPVEIYDRPKNIFVANFIGEMNFYEGVVVERKEDSLTVDVDGYLFKAKHADSPSHVVIAIRPENLVLKKRKEGINTLRGRVKDSSFVRGTHRVEVKLENGREATVKLFNPFIEKVFERGNRLNVYFPPESIHVYPYPREGLRTALSVE